MSDFSESELDTIWEKGFEISGYNKDKYRLDAADAMMQRDKYGEEGLYGWEVDHIFPKAKLEQERVPEYLWDHIDNLRPMNAKNNASKGDDYPVYEASMKYNLATKLNEEIQSSRTIDNNVQIKLKKLFGLEKKG